VINSAEPLVTKQRITHFLLHEWKDELEAKADSLKCQGEAFGEGDDPSEFDDWHSDSDKFLSTVVDFARWGAYGPIKGVEELREVFGFAERPYEPELDIRDETEFRPSGPYWTIQRLFEDL